MIDARFHTVTSIEAGTPLVWQAELLAYTFRKSGQRGPLTVLCAGGPVSIGDAHVVATPNFRFLDGGDYAAYNKPCSLLWWLQNAPPDEEEILVVDADMVFVGPLPPVVTAPRLAVGQDWSRVSSQLTGFVTQRHTLHPDRLQATGVHPGLIRRQDLEDLCPLWIERTMELRRVRGQVSNPWIVEMMAYVSAAADIGLRHVLMDWDRYPVVHYFHPFRRPEEWSWSKHRYRPWERLREWPRADDAPAMALARLLDEYAALRGGAALRAAAEPAPAWRVEAAADLLRAQAELRQEPQGMSAAT